MSTITLPIVGPDPLTPAWYEARLGGIFASESGRACNVSPYGTDLDIYCEKTRLVEPFEGNAHTQAGHDLEPFMAKRYCDRVQCEIETDLPMYLHGALQYLGATPDARRRDNFEYLAEFKFCNWRRAQALGDVETDQIFEDWVLQAQQQMFVTNARVVDVFVMIDPLTFKLFTVERNERLIGRMIEIETDLWNRILKREPPAPHYEHPSMSELIEKLFGVKQGSTITLPDEVAVDWEKSRELARQLEELENQRQAVRARVLFSMGDAAIARLPFGQGELTRTVVRESSYTVNRKSYVCLRQRA